MLYDVKFLVYYIIVKIKKLFKKTKTWNIRRKCHKNGCIIISTSTLMFYFYYMHLLLCNLSNNINRCL